jgi:hypothetical protein
MPTGVPFGAAIKELMFRIIKFVESEKEGPVIPLYNTTGRLEAMLGIGRTTVFKLRSEMYTLEVDKKHVDEDKMVLRHRTVPDISVSPKRSRRKCRFSLNIPMAGSPKKKGNS